MKNVDRLAKYITQNGSNGILIHTIPGTQNWIIAQKINEDSWMLTLGDPMGNVTYNVGTVTDKQHTALWRHLVQIEIESRKSQVLLAKELREIIHRFIKSYENKYKKFTKPTLNKKGNKGTKKGIIKNNINPNIIPR